jgi:glycerol kinase
LGAAYLAGLAVKYWDNIEEIKKQWQLDKEFVPGLSNDKADQMKARWADAVKRAKSWTKH